jgi:ribonuclease HI
MQQESGTLRIYTDCEAIVGLPRRRADLEQNEFLSRRSGKPLSNADLYQELYRRFDTLKPEILWVKGHSSSKAQDIIQTRFSMVDRAARYHLRLMTPGLIV